MVLDVGMAIPGLAVSEIDLDDAHATLHKAESHQTASRKVSLSVPLSRCLTFLPDIENVRRFCLHPIGNFHGLDGRFQLRLARSFFEVPTVELFQQFKLTLLLRQAELLVADVLDELLRIALLGGDVSSLVNRRKKRRIPKRRPHRGRSRTEHHKTWQALV